MERNVGKYAGKERVKCWRETVEVIDPQDLFLSSQYRWELIF
jgi:hypothetical protein